MAEIIKVIELADGTLTNMVDKNSKLSVNYKPVTTWYDGSAMDASKVDGDLYTKKGSKYYRKVIDKDGELFLEKNTMSQMRALTPLEILYIKAGIYKGVKLSGYLEEGDTPAPINYFLINTSVTDDGGSVIDVGGIKLEHGFGDYIDIRYYGIFPSSADISSVLQKIIDNIKNIGGTIYIPIGTYLLFNDLNLTNIQKQIHFKGGGIRECLISVAITDGVGFDCTGGQFFIFSDFSLYGNPSLTPNVGFLLARNSTNNSAGRIQFRNVDTGGNFKVAPLYNYASEEFRADNCYFINNYGGGYGTVLTRDNFFGISSKYVSIATGGQSTTEIRFINTAINNYQTTGEGACLYIRGISSLSLVNMFLLNNRGNFIVFDISDYHSANINIESVMLDGDATTIDKAILIKSNSSSPNESKSLNYFKLSNILDYGVKPSGDTMYCEVGAQLSFCEFGLIPATGGFRFFIVNYSNLNLPYNNITFAYSVTNNIINTRSDKLTLLREDLFLNNQVNFLDTGGKYFRKTLGAPSITPFYNGEEVFDDTNKVWYKSKGLTSSDWISL